MQKSLNFFGGIRYVKVDDAVKLYQKASDAKVIREYTNDDGSYMHAELDVFGQILALSELGEEKSITGNTMQFCLHFGSFGTMFL